MNIKLLTLSATASAVLTAATPMVPASMSTDNGGTKSAIDAYSDGGGVVIINQAGDTKFDNSAMNGLVFKYGQKAEDSGTTLKNQVSVLSTDTSAAEKAISAKFDLAKVVINPPVNGTSCDDGNPQTVTDVWTSGLCVGNNIENQSCNDGNIQTINDKYHNGICGGVNVEGVACDDTNALTFADKYTNGVCAGVTNGTTCNDGNSLTFADKYTAGICAGIANGTTCNDSNVQTINDIYTSGVCAGTNVEGQACNDSVAYTYADKYTNGVCAGTLAISCKAIKTLAPSTVSGVYTINPGSLSPTPVYCDMVTDGGGWTLIGKGRQGWSFADAGQGAISTLANSSTTADVAALPIAYVNAIISNKTLNTLNDGMVIERLDGLNQRIQWKFTAVSNFNWTIDTAPKNVNSYMNGVYRYNTGTNDDWDTQASTNNCSRVFTWAWDGHAFVKGFSTGATCLSGWQNGTEGHGIPMSKVWVRD